MVSAHDAFIMKPVELETLLGQVGEVLGLQWVYEPLAAPIIENARPLPELSGTSPQHIDALYQLGRIGHVRGIEAEVARDRTARCRNFRACGPLTNADLKFRPETLYERSEELREKG